jgi:uncharacterized protein (TIGR00369 family)
VAVSNAHFEKLTRMYLGAPINRYFTPRIEISAGQAIVTLPGREDFHHAASAVHGAVYFKALDDAAFFAANSLVDDVFVLTVAFTVHFTRPVTEGTITATGRVVHRSRRMLIADAEAVDTAGRVVARGTGTFMRSEVPLSPAIGYR